MLDLAFSASKARRIHTQASIPATLLKYARDLHHLVSNSQRLIANFSADVSGKCPVDVEEGIGLEDPREHANVLEVDDADFIVRVGEEVLLDVGAETPAGEK